MASSFPSPGQRLGHYQLLEQIGAGGMGLVFLAHDERLDRDVALKVLTPGTLTDDNARRRFRKEALTLSQLNHPNIETVHDFDAQDGVDYLVMELISGITLDEKLASRPLAEKEIVELGIQLAQGLETAHEQGVIHRDLKPGNLRVTADGRLKILDFGLAKLLRPVSDSAATDSLSQTKGVAGTLPYMSPEQLRGVKVDARSDLYAAGAVLYEMATGRRPFPGSGASLIDAILNHKPTAPSALNRQISPALEAIILKALEKEPDQRHFSARELLVNLQRVSTGTAATAAAPQAAGFRSRRRMAAALAAAAVIVLAAVGFNLGGLRDRMFSRGGSAVQTAAGKPSVAVLPFQNMSADPGNEYFSDGMTEEIISKLSRVHNLEVASRTSVMRYKGTQKDIKAIGQELGVRYVLEGSVRKASERVRITAQLIDASSGFHLWSDDFDGDLKDVFGVQDQTALKIVQALNLRLSPQEQQAVRRRYTDNPQAYDAYLRGRAQMSHFDSPAKLEAARRYFESALKSDPDYAPALAGLAQVETDYYRNVDPKAAHLQRAEELARHALALDPQLAEAHNAMGNVLANHYDYGRAVEEFRRAIQADPSDPSTWGQLAWTLNYEQPPDSKGAEEAARTAIRLQPSGSGSYYEGSYYQLGRSLLLQGRYPEAVSAFDHALALNPNYNSPHLGLGQVYLAQGRYEQALAELAKSPEVPLVMVQRASVYASRGEKRKALAELEKALALNYRDFAYLDASPYLASLRSDARYQELMRRYRK